MAGLAAFTEAVLIAQCRASKQILADGRRRSHWASMT
jgi:hypothetical protein